MTRRLLKLSTAINLSTQNTFTQQHILQANKRRYHANLTLAGALLRLPINRAKSLIHWRCKGSWNNSNFRKKIVVQHVHISHCVHWAVLTTETLFYACTPILNFSTLSHRQWRFCDFQFGGGGSGGHGFGLGAFNRNNYRFPTTNHTIASHWFWCLKSN